jgi:hypothetical protein
MASFGALPVSSTFSRPAFIKKFDREPAMRFSVRIVLMLREEKLKLREIVWTVEQNGARELFA